MIPTTVVIVSRHRPDALVRAMVGMAQQDHAALELVVVADPAGAAAARATGLPARIIDHDAEGISAARNIGIDVAAGQVIAFLDDDAVPEPTWATRLTAPFADPTVMQAGGFVLGPDGLRWQWQAMEVDATGQDHPFVADATILRQGTAQRAIKTQGTNCAFRTTTLRAVGGFDPSFRFYLDEADVNLRMASRGRTAIIPDAVVHHGYLPSRRRRADRVPTDLSDIAASLAHFLRRHAPMADHASLMTAEAARQRARLIRHMVAGRLEPRDVGRIMATFTHGDTQPTALMPRPEPAIAFLGLPTSSRPGLVLTGKRATVLRQAQDLTATHVVTAICFGPTWHRRRHQFLADGLWLIDGGLYGPGRTKRSFAPAPMQIAKEIAVLAGFRPTTP